MNCAVHTDQPAAAYCRSCGKALCETCKRDVMGAIYCEPCIAARLQGAAPAPGRTALAPGAATVQGTPSPGVAMLLGFIPGVGAMYNGQFMKAFIHVMIFVMLILAANNVSGLFGILIGFFVVYMAFDAYKTAEAKRLGLPLPDPLGLDRLFGLHEGQHTAPSAAVSTPSAPAAPQVSSAAVYTAPPAGESAHRDNAPVGAIVLIALGVVFLLSNVVSFNLHKFWPLILIGVGVWLAYKRLGIGTGEAR